MEENLDSEEEAEEGEMGDSEATRVFFSFVSFIL